MLIFAWFIELMANEFLRHELQIRKVTRIIMGILISVRIAKLMADGFNKHLIGVENVEVPTEMKERVGGKDYGYGFYNDRGACEWGS